MLDHIKLEKLLFLDIETVPMVPSYEQLPNEMKALWDRKASHFKATESSEELFTRAGIYAEFGKIICISVAFLVQDINKVFHLRMKSFYGDDERQLLTGFANMLTKAGKKGNNRLCAHNGKEFDIPYIARRMLINRLTLPQTLDFAGKKPWEVPHIDTMELWRFGDYKHFTPLNLLTHIFNIPSPKEDIDGSDVWRVYWQDKDLPRIVDYCQRDVVAVVQLMLRYKGLALLEDSQLEIID